MNIESYTKGGCKMIKIAERLYLMQKSIHCVQEKIFDKKKMYYSTQCPIGPGTYPKDGIIEIVNYCIYE